MPGNVQRAVERAARDSYGRLVAWLASRGQDLQVAEDAVGDALEAALRVWPERGVPDNPEAWLLTTARRRVIDGARRQKTRIDAVDRLRMEAHEAADSPFLTQLPDRRLALMFVCTHPKIPANIRTPLILQTVLGLTAERIAGPMLVRPAVIGQRLVRAKRSIKEAGLSFDLPPAKELPARLSYVLEAIYAAYGRGWEATGDAESSESGLAQEALWLSRLLIDLLPDAPEAKGLYALMLYCESRRAARRGPNDDFVPLHSQDTRLWQQDLIDEAEKALWMAAQKRQPGPYQMEAAIQSLHSHRAKTGQTDWVKIHQLYNVLRTHYPSLGATIGYAASFGELDQSADGLAVLDGLPEKQVVRHQPYWAVRAHLLRRLGAIREAQAAYTQAAGLTADPAVRRWLLEQISALK